MLLVKRLEETKLGGGDCKILLIFAVSKITVSGTSSISRSLENSPSHMSGLIAINRLHDLASAFGHAGESSCCDRHRYFGP